MAMFGTEGRGTDVEEAADEGEEEGRGGGGEGKRSAREKRESALAGLTNTGQR